MTTQETRTVTIKNYFDGKTIGQIEISQDLYDAYAYSEAHDFQWPEGIIGAEDFLTPEQIEEFGISAHTTIFLDI